MNSNTYKATVLSSVGPSHLGGVRFLLPEVYGSSGVSPYAYPEVQGGVTPSVGEEIIIYFLSGDTSRPKYRRTAALSGRSFSRVAVETRLSSDVSFTTFLESYADADFSVSSNSQTFRMEGRTSTATSVVVSGYLYLDGEAVAGPVNFGRTGGSVVFVVGEISLSTLITGLAPGNHTASLMCVSSASGSTSSGERHIQVVEVA